MSDLGDSFREWRQAKQAYRRTLVACWRCGLKNKPDEPCIKCEPEEWEAWSASRQRDGVGITRPR